MLEAVRVVARALDLAPAGLELIAADRARRKRSRIVGVDADELDRRLQTLRAD